MGGNCEANVAVTAAIFFALVCTATLLERNAMLLYHYCSNSSFLSLIQSRVIYSSDLSLSNDHLEGKWTREIFSELCKEHPKLSTYHEKLIAELDFLISFFGATGFCLSEHEDQLSQWRGYADNGAGICIGFDKSYLESLEADEGYSLSLSKVVYDRAEQAKILSSHLDPIHRAIQSGAFRLPIGNILFEMPEQEKAQIEKARKDLHLVFLAMFPHLFTLKNSAFREEAEWRLISLLTIKHSNVDDRELDKLDFLGKLDRIVPYRKVPVPDGPIQSIARVVLGPRNITPPEIVSAALKRFGFQHVRVSRSTASYR